MKMRPRLKDLRARFSLSVVGGKASAGGGASGRGVGAVL